MTTDPRKVLGVLADLAAVSAGRKSISVEPRDFQWLPLSCTSLFSPDLVSTRDAPIVELDAKTKRILKLARLRSDPPALRVGWIWVAGRTPKNRKVLTPLASMPVGCTSYSSTGIGTAARSLVRAGSEATSTELVAEGELELTDLITNDRTRDQLGDMPRVSASFGANASSGAPELDTDDLAGSEMADLISWATAASAAAGLETNVIASVTKSAYELIAMKGLRIVVGAALYTEDLNSVSRRITTASTLRSWAEVQVEGTAFAWLYSDTSDADDALPDDVVRPATSIRLNPAQRRVVEASATQRLTVVSGPPGTGKSQTVVAAAHHNVSLGRKVLVTAPTEASVTALVELLENSPGPDPVVFGSSSKRITAATRLGEGAGPWYDDDAVAVAQRTAAQASDERNSLRHSMITLLSSEAAAAGDSAALLVARQAAPGLFADRIEIASCERLLAAAENNEGWVSSWKARRALTKLQKIAGCREEFSVAQLEPLLETAAARQRALTLQRTGGLDLTDSWLRLARLDDRALVTQGDALHALTHHDDRADRAARRAIGSVATALRSGRSARRRALAKVRGRTLTDALPLWVATLSDIDDLLPLQTDMFDLVIIDEASHVDQINAAPALLRAASALIVGDPKQLRHVSFLPDERVQEVLEENGLVDQPVAAQLDLRRQTIFDAASSVSPIVMLDEHYRSAPHLISFSADRFYDERLNLATRHPRNEVDDRISLIRVDGRRTTRGVNRIEVEAIVARLQQELEAGSRSVGVLTPFRAQADAIWDAAAEAFDLHDLDQLNLRVGTVHAFQGCQRDTIYISLAIDDDSARGSTSFLSDPMLFNVMVTRAKERVHVVSSQDPDATSGILSDYLRHAESPPRATSEAGDLRSWSETVRRELDIVEIAHSVGYRSGRHVIDLVVGRGEYAVALSCGVHPDGPNAHIQRHLDLVRAGWVVIDVFESRWSEQLSNFTIELVDKIDGV